MMLKNIRRGRVKEYTEKYPSAVYTQVDPDIDFNPLWNHKADCAFPSATQNEIKAQDAQNLVDNGVKAVAEQYNKPGNYMVGANIAGFVKVVEAMIDQGLV